MRLILETNETSFTEKPKELIKEATELKKLFSAIFE